MFLVLGYLVHIPARLQLEYYEQAFTAKKIASVRSRASKLIEERELAELA